MGFIISMLASWSVGTALLCLLTTSKVVATPAVGPLQLGAFFIGGVASLVLLHALVQKLLSSLPRVDIFLSMKPHLFSILLQPPYLQ